MGEQDRMTDSLRQLAQEASSGPWKAKEDGNVAYNNQAQYVESDCRMIVYNNVRAEDARYIAAANPAVILRLLDAVDKAREATKYAIRVIEASTEFRQGNPASEQGSAALRSSLAALEGMTP